MVFTTSQVARICKVSQTVIIRCFDSGKLKGFRLPVGNRHRRIPRKCLEKFMDKYEIPRDLLEKEIAAQNGKS